MTMLENQMVQTSMPNGTEVDLGLYVHIPFCAKRCHFCAFYLVMHQDQRVEQFLGALEAECSLYSWHPSFAGRRISTVYIGGGTPTVLSSAQLSGLLLGIAQRFSLTKGCEVTVEATPESLTAASVERLQQAGVTRLSLGVQSFDPQERSRLGLSGSKEQVMAGIQSIKQAGLSNFNLDLLYGIPGQSIQSWDRTLTQACDQNPSHLSCYALTLEEGTRFQTEVRRGLLDMMEPEKEWVFQQRAIERLDAMGYQQYELSNWAKPGQACAHNLRYWNGLEYLGLGPSAQSYVGGNHFGNVPSLEQYCLQLQKGQFPIAEQETLSTHQQEKERVVFGLRLLDGVPRDWVASLGHDQCWFTSFKILMEEEYLTQTSSRVCLTPKGRQFADTVGMRLL